MSASAFSPAVRLIVVQRSMGMCEACGRGLSTGPGSAEIHHRLPRGAGGSHLALKGRASNALRLCLECHRFCETNAPAVYVNGWKVRHGQIPTDVPVLLSTPYGKGWWLLDDVGCYLPADAA